MHAYPVENLHCKIDLKLWLWIGKQNITASQILLDRILFLAFVFSTFSCLPYFYVTFITLFSKRQGPTGIWIFVDDEVIVPNILLTNFLAYSFGILAAPLVTSL